MPGVLVIGELTEEGQPAGITAELAAAGRPLADELGEPLVAAIMGTDVQEAAKAAIAMGADKAYAVEDPLLDDPSAFDAQVAAAEKLCQELKPGIVLLGRTLIGRDVAPRLAFRLGTSLANDCTELKLESGSKDLVVARPVFGGNAVAEERCLGEVKVATLRVRAYEAPPPDTSRQGEVETFKPGLDASVVKARLVQRVKEEAGEGIRLEDAKVVVGGGRGLGSSEPFKRLEEIADLLGGAVGASRAVCDAGWMPATMQIGLTGKTVTPDLYIAIAISGASQHMAGCSGSKVIVAVNKDAEANIFKEARYGAVGEWQNVLPAFIEQLRELVK